MQKTLENERTDNSKTDAGALILGSATSRTAGLKTTKTADTRAAGTAESGANGTAGPITNGMALHKFGTVGAVALDKYGDLAAGTSTGGLTGKRWGRVGDSPVIGAGTFADNDSCAVSCTGHGEWFIKYNVAADLAARVKYQHRTVEQAAEEIIHGVLSAKRGEGGLIALDRKGNFALQFNSEGMYRGYTTDGQPHTFIY